MRVANSYSCYDVRQVAYRSDINAAGTIFAAAAMHKIVKVTCTECRHYAVFDSHGLWWLFHRKGWKGELIHARNRFWCQRCSRDQGTKVKQAIISFTTDKPTVKLALPDEREWKRAVDHYRG